MPPLSAHLRPVSTHPAHLRSLDSLAIWLRYSHFRSTSLPTLILLAPHCRFRVSHLNAQPHRRRHFRHAYVGSLRTRHTLFHLIWLRFGRDIRVFGPTSPRVDLVCIAAFWCPVGPVLRRVGATIGIGTPRRYAPGASSITSFGADLAEIFAFPPITPSRVDLVVYQLRQ